ncbi:SOS-response transcriptional repressor LexA [Pantoea dispersa]|nr:SOS-response transcriptional repressor LexA [Pantoea dispersa]
MNSKITGGISCAIYSALSQSHCSMARASDHEPSSCTAGLTLLWPPIFTPRVRVPLYADPCAAGFPAPAQDYVEKELDLNELCIRRRASTFFVRASGNSMRDLGLCDGDVMVVDRIFT